VNSCAHASDGESAIVRGSETARTSPPRLLTVLRVLAGYGSHFLGSGVFVLLVLPLAVLLAPFPRLKHKCLHAIIHSYLAFYTRVCLPALGVYRLAEVSGMENLDTQGPVIYAANHRSRLDAPLLLGLLKQTGVVIKSKYTAAPALAALVTHFDFVSTDPGQLSSLAGALDKCRGLIGKGRSLLVFPEGSRATSGRLQPFKDFAFKLAVGSGCPVVPVIVHSTHPFLTRAPGSLFPGGRNVFRVRFLEPERIRPADTQDSLSDRVRGRMAAELRKLDAGTGWDLGRPERA